MREMKFRGSLKIQSYEITGSLEDSEFLEGGLWVRTKGGRKKRGHEKRKDIQRRKGEEGSTTKQSKRSKMIYQRGFSYQKGAFASTLSIDSSFILVILLLCINLRWILSFVWMLGCRMTKVICLFVLVLDCFYSC